jgi:uncharacterized protein (DUF362 family)
MSCVAKVKFTDYQASISRALDLINAPAGLPQEGLIIIKPNLTNSSPPPVTTSVKAAEALYNYLKARTKAEIVIADGCGSGTTPQVFKTLGYTALAEKYGMKLIDLNDGETVTVKNDKALLLKEFHMSKIVRDAFVISLPVLKDHSFTKTTIAMKNMFGIASAKFYSGSWNKSKLHNPSTDKSVVDVCLYKKPDLSVVDASVALEGMHLSGRHKKMGLILAGLDPVAVDTVGSELLGHNPRKIPYLTLSHGLHGSMENIEIISA